MTNALAGGKKSIPRVAAVLGCLVLLAMIATSSLLLAWLTGLDVDGALLRIHLAAGVVSALGSLLVTGIIRSRQRDAIDRGLPADDRAGTLARTVDKLLRLIELCSAGLIAPFVASAAQVTYPLLRAPRRRGCPTVSSWR